MRHDKLDEARREFLEFIDDVVDEMDERVPDMARQVLKLIVSQIEDNQTGIAELDAHFM